MNGAQNIKRCSKLLEMTLLIKVKFVQPSQDLIKVLVYEEQLRGTTKPDHNSDRSVKEDFIFQKYKHRAFISSSTLEVRRFIDNGNHK